MASRSRHSKDGRPSTVSAHAPEPRNFLVAALTSMCRSDANNTDPFGDRLELADRHLGRLLAKGTRDGNMGLCDDLRLDALVASMAVEYERVNRLKRSYAQDRARVEALEHGEDPRQGDANHLCMVRYAERWAAFALGVALGLRMGGAR